MTKNESIGSLEKTKKGIMKATIVFILAESLFLFCLNQIFLGNITNLPVLHLYFYHYFRFMFYEPNGSIGPSSNWVPFEFDAFLASLAGWQTVMFQRVVWLITTIFMILSITTPAIYLVKFHKLNRRICEIRPTFGENILPPIKLKSLIPLLASGTVVAYYWVKILLGNIIFLPGFHYIFGTYFRGYLEVVNPFSNDGYPIHPIAVAQNYHFAVYFIWAVFNVFSAGLALIGVVTYSLMEKKTSKSTETISSSRPEIQ